MAVKMFFVAMTKGRTDRASASVVDDPVDDPTSRNKLIKQFFREYVGHEIRHVNGDEMQKLMKAE